MTVNLESLDVLELGDLVAIHYRRPGDRKNGKTRVHDCGPGVKLYATADGRHLVAGGGAMIVRKRGRVLEIGG